MKINHLEKVFQTLCEIKASQLNCLTTDYQSNSKEAIFAMDFETIRLEVIYTKKNKMFIPPSMIYVRFYTDKNSSIYYHLPEIISFLEETDFRACYFPYIENIYRMNQCFLSLFEIVEEYLEIIKEWDMKTKYEIMEYQCKFLAREFSQEDIEDTFDSERKFYERFYLLNRFSVFEGYYAFLNDDYQKAIQDYQKLSTKETLMDYEIQLLEYMQTMNEYDAIRDECFALRDVQPYLETSKKNGIDFLVFTGVMAILCVTGMCTFMGILEYILSNQTSVYCGAGWYWGALCGLLPSIFGGIACRRQIMSLLRYKDLIRALDFDDILNSTFTNRFAQGSFIIASLITIFFAVVLSIDCVRFYDSYLDIAGSTFIQRKEYSYESIEHIYHIDARYNDYGDRIERESYILYFENGDYLDLDGYTSIEISENEIIPLIGLDVENVDSDKDLDFMKE